MAESKANLSALDKERGGVLIKVGARGLTKGELTEEFCVRASLSLGEALALKMASAGTGGTSVVGRRTGKEV
ncbi:hypothetical protein E2C01_070304 [Portunus trituberculatus]|uniref:Uncharacterized protein n=1 Tax=Portunus trituberculatus TaxID=210409 RepID=A0A5B7I185_PORTR|nr:hypothetical protein [Portunus trituberculatus]